MNARQLFESLDPGQLGYLTLDSLRLVRGRLAFCDYRELVKSELGDFNQTLRAADVNGDLQVRASSKNLFTVCKYVVNSLMMSFLSGHSCGVCPAGFAFLHHGG